MLFKWSQLATCINYCYLDAAVQEVWPIPNLDSLIELNINMFGIWVFESLKHFFSLKLKLKGHMNLRLIELKVIKIVGTKVKVMPTLGQDNF